MWRRRSCLRRRDSSRRSGTLNAAPEEGRDERGTVPAGNVSGGGNPSAPRRVSDLLISWNESELFESIPKHYWPPMNADERRSKQALLLSALSAFIGGSLFFAPPPRDSVLTGAQPGRSEQVSQSDSSAAPIYWVDLRRPETRLGALGLPPPETFPAGTVPRSPRRSAGLAAKTAWRMLKRFREVLPLPPAPHGRVTHAESAQP